MIMYIRMKTLNASAPRTLARLWALLPAVVLLAGCEKPNEFVEPPPPPVTAAQPVQKDVIDYLEFTGTTRALEKVEVRARVPGFLQSIDFTPSAFVEEGDLLFVIDPREYEAELAASKAELESAKAQFERAEIELGRAERLFKQQAGSEADVVKWRGERNVAEAAIARAEAQVERARLNLSYTRVTAPIDGQVDRNLVDVGNLVGEGEPTLLTTVTKYQPIYAYFNLNERDLLRAKETYGAKVQALVEAGDEQALANIKEAEIPLYLGLANEEGYPHEGTLDYSSPSVDPDTGTIELRGRFPNEGLVPKILPGLFTRIRMPIQRRQGALLVDERAIGADQSGRYLLTVNDDNVVEKRLVQVGQLVEGMRVIEQGIQPGEWIIINGVQRARPGGKVNPEQVEMPRSEALAAASATGDTKPSPEHATSSDVSEPDGGSDASTDTESEALPAAADEETAREPATTATADSSQAEAGDSAAAASKPDGDTAGEPAQKP
jgi:RND family efflux transporter MFP subunit